MLLVDVIRNYHFLPNLQHSTQLCDRRIQTQHSVVQIDYKFLCHNTVSDYGWTLHITYRNMKNYTFIGRQLKNGVPNTEISNVKKDHRTIMIQEVERG
jgi:hypothetical protein